MEKDRGRGGWRADGDQALRGRASGWYDTFTSLDGMLQEAGNTTVSPAEEQSGQICEGFECLNNFLKVNPRLN